MNNCYTKLFHQLVNSSIWDESNETRIVWITLLVMTDRDGEVQSTIKSLARNARVSVDSAQSAIGKFLSPDPDSRTKDNDGRRVEVIEGGWRVLNHRKYRDLMDSEQRREYYRLKKREYREREKNLTEGLTMKQVIHKKLAAEKRLLNGEVEN